MDELKPCPHCGGTAKLDIPRGNSEGPGHSSVECKTGGARGGQPRGEFDWRCAYSQRGVSEAQGVAAHDAEAVRLWNQRA